MKKIKRFLSLLIVATMIILSVLPVSASETSLDDSKVEVTEELAISMAEKFAVAFYPDGIVTANNPMKFYDKTGQAIGYIVNYYIKDVPCGYVIFDNTQSSLISEYSFGVNTKNPYEIISEIDSALINKEYVEGKIYKIAPFTYGVVDNAGDVKTNYGETLPATDAISESSGKDPVSWDKVFFDISDIYEDYDLIATNYIQQFISFNETYIENTTGHYACAVSALLACAAYYGAINWNNIAGDYMDIWNATNTEVTELNLDRNVVYGSTSTPNIGPGFVNYCASRGVSVNQNTQKILLGYSFFTDCINSGNMAVVCCGIIKSDTNQYSGHAMAVEGYATVVGRETGKTVHTLMVFDGWGDEVRYLNFDYENWESISGVAFNG